MGPKKDTTKNRDATIVYPRTSPELVLAYRIFGPGYDTIQNLDRQYNYVVKPNHPMEGESWLTPVGLDISLNMKISVDKIKAAYEAYKKEIERMNKVDRLNHMRKQAQLDGVDPENIYMEQGDDRDDSSDGMAGFPSSSGSDDQLEEDEDGSDEGESEGEENDDAFDDEEDDEEDDEDDDEEDVSFDEDDPFKHQFLTPEMWLTKEEALARTKKMRETLDKMWPTLDKLLENWSESIPSTSESNQAMENAANNFLNLRRFAYNLEKLITLHDNKTPETMWVSPSQKNVTYGEKVGECHFFVHTTPDRAEVMRKALLAVDKVRVRFLEAPTVADKKQLFSELMYNVRRFAAQSITKEYRGRWLRQLAEERNRRSKYLFLSQPHQHRKNW
jgi:hypothetical protein